MSTGNQFDPNMGMFREVKICAEEVDGAALLNEIYDLLRRHAVADPETLWAATLWTAHSWCMDSQTISPIALITAPEKRCGKTVLLMAMSRLVCRPLPASNISPAAIYRCIERYKPTLLLDEADTYLGRNADIRGLINSGLYHESAFVMRAAEGRTGLAHYSTWAPKVICGIGRMAETLEDRSIPLRMRRKAPDEVVENIRNSDDAQWSRMHPQLARWACDHAEHLKHANPESVPGLNDRAQDCWSPLLAIADLAGGEWPTRARQAARVLNAGRDIPSIGTELLGEVRDIFTLLETGRISSRALLERLSTNDGGVWSCMSQARKMTVRDLGIQLGAFGVHPKTLRLASGERAKGYDLSDLQEPFRCYLPPVETEEADA